MANGNFNKATYEKLVNSNAARIWRTTCYLLSAVMGALALSDATKGEYASALELLGSTVVMGGLSFRSIFVAVALYLPEGEEKTNLTRLLLARERKTFPWLRYCVRGGWIMLITGLVLTLVFGK